MIVGHTSGMLMRPTIGRDTVVAIPRTDDKKGDCCEQGLSKGFSFVQRGQPINEG